MDSNFNVNMQQQQHTNDASFSDNQSGSFRISEGETNHKSDEEKEIIVEAETKSIFKIRILFSCVLIISMISIALTVYYYIANREKADFEKQFYQDSSKIFEAVGSVLASSLGAVDSFSVNMVSYSKYSNETWPFVTIPEFAIRCAKLLSLSKATVISTYPIVSTEQREKWENYSLANDWWVDEGIVVQNNDEHFKGRNVTEWSPFPVIHGNSGPIEVAGKTVLLHQILFIFLLLIQLISVRRSLSSHMAVISCCSSLGSLQLGYRAFRCA